MVSFSIALGNFFGQRCWKMSGEKIKAAAVPLGRKTAVPLTPITHNLSNAIFIQVKDAQATLAALGQRQKLPRFCVIS
jgi:hypothetical protein